MAETSGRGGPGENLVQHLDQRFKETLFERVPAVVYVAELGGAGRWPYITRRIEDLLGYTPEEWMADPGLWAERLHPEDRGWILAESGNTVPVPGTGSRFEYRLIDRGGRTVWVLDDATIELDDEGNPLWHGVMHDVTDRKQAERAIERLASRQASIVALGEQAILGADPTRLMAAATRYLKGGGATHAFIWERTPRSGRLRLRSGLEQAHGTGPVAAGDGTHVAAALHSSEPLVVPDWTREAETRLPQGIGDLGIRSSIAVVIEGDDGPFGVLDIHSERPEHFESGDVHLARSAANVLASSIQRRRADEQLRHRVLHDELTGLPNRQLFLDLLAQALDRSARSDNPLAVLFLDLDHFKLINDSLGHHVGDQLLRIVAPRLVGRLRPADVVARFGGDEFGMLIEDLVDQEEALAVAERIGDAIARPIGIEGIEHFVTASIGIAVADPRSGKGGDSEELIRDADAAMYKAKEGGRACSRLFGEEMRAHAFRRMEIQRRLRHAVERQELFLEYQPVVELGSGAITGVEALARWHHSEWGVLQPAQFISVAEESGLIGEIGHWVLSRALSDAASWDAPAGGGPRASLAVNISARQVTQRGFAAMVEELLATTGLEPERLSLEMTETVLAEHSDLVTDTLEALDRLGVSLILDDFGTGYSSLAYLSRFPFKHLKIDRSFVERLDADPLDREGTAIVEAILAMASALSLGVVAEGVSTETQVEKLRKMGCANAQGFILARPMPSPEISSYLRRSEIVIPGEVRSA